MVHVKEGPFTRSFTRTAKYIYTEAYAESTGVAFELRRRARRSAAQRARVVARAREHLALYRK